MSSTLSNLYTQYLLLSKTYEQAIQEYNLENKQNIKTNVILNLNNDLTKTFYVGKYNDLLKYYDTTENIKSIDIYDGLLVTLYKEINCSGEFKSYMNTKTDDYTHYEINTTYKSLQVELIEKNYDTYPEKIFSPNGLEAPYLVDNKSNNLDECADVCIDNNCSASIYNSAFNTCSVYKASGTLENGALEDNTIIPVNKRKLLIITELNAKLKELIKQIHINSVLVLNENELSLQQKQISFDEYSKNKSEMEKLQTQLKHQKEIFQSLESELTNSSTIITRNVNLYYLMWIFLIVLVFMIIKSIVMPDKNNPEILVWVILIICILLASYNINNPNGYLLWCILILIFLLKIILPRI